MLPLPAAATDLSFVIAEKSWVNDEALTSGTEAAGAPAEGELPLDGVVPPDELLPHAAAASPRPRSAAVSARLLVNDKMFLQGPGWSVGATGIGGSTQRSCTPSDLTAQSREHPVNIRAAPETNC
jgi:hypothetical protein